MATEKRLIDAGDLWSDIMMLPHNGDMISSEEVEQAIKEAPTVDAVEVVRCGECEYFYEPFCCRRDDETHRERINMLTVDFCSYGKKKNGGGSNGI